MRGSPPDLAEVRVLLSDLLRTDSELDAFCIDYFPRVHVLFTRGLDRIQKVNLLFEAVREPARILSALRQRFPQDRRLLSPAWTRPTSGQQRPGTARALRSWGTVLCLLAAVLLAGWLAHRPGARPPSVCPALHIDDVVVAAPAASAPVVLNVMVRNPSLTPANTTRADLHILSQQEERAPYLPSAHYDLLVSAEHNELAVAHLLRPGDIDHFELRLGFPPAGPAHEYEAELRLQHSGGCTATSGRFVFSSSSHSGPAPQSH